MATYSPSSRLLLAVAATIATAASAQGWTRPYYAGGPLTLNTTTLQYDIDGSIDVAGDFDLAVIDADSWGVPWDAFIYEQPLPFSWENKLNNTVDAWRSWNRPLVLKLPMGDSDSKRSCPAQNASDAPGGYPNLQPVGGCQACFDWNTTTNPVAAFFRQGYTNYVIAMTLAFSTNQPSPNAPLVGVSFAIDANRVLEAGCGAAWMSAYIEFSNQVYEGVKEYLPTVPLFPSFHLESMYGLQDGQPCSGGVVNMGASKPSPTLLACFDAGYDAFSTMKRDVFAFSVNPSQNSGNVWAPWYFTAALDRLDPGVDSTNQWLISTGFQEDDIVVNAANTTGSGKQPKPVCVPVFTSNVSAANDWLTMVVEQATAYKLQVVGLTHARDILFSQAMTSCPCAYPPGTPAWQAYCNYLTTYRQICYTYGLPSYVCEINAKLWGGTMGVRDLLNKQKQPLWTTLQDARAAAVAPEVAQALLLKPQAAQ